MGDQLLSVNGVANKFNVSKPTIYRWLKTGKLPGRKVGGQWRFAANAVQQAFLEGDLSGDTPKKQTTNDVLREKPIPSWAKPMLAEWSQMANKSIDELNPDHVVVNDRRGAKIWELISNDSFRYAKDLWHSTAISYMPFTELYETFANKKVLLFDEMMQHGREMQNLRQRLTYLNSSIESLVCIRNKSHIESGDLIDYKSHAFENLDADEFADKAAMISRLLDYFDPPLDVGHLIVRGKYSGSDDYSILLKKLAKWGLPFVIRYPDNEHPYLTITLDRPQFFDTSTLTNSKNIKLSWDGPCKIRFYINIEDRNCYFSFIVFPGMEAPSAELIKLDNQFLESKKNTKIFSQLSQNETPNSQFRRIYDKLCMDLSINLLNDFIECGAPQDMGIIVNKTIHKADLKHLEAIFGTSKGKEIEAKVNKILSITCDTMPLFEKNTSLPPPLLLRGPQGFAENEFGSQNAFECRVLMLRKIPPKYTSKDSKDTEIASINYKQLVDKLRPFSESTIGKVIDYGLDWGIIKPTNQSYVFFESGVEKVKIERSFSRGEFGAWFEFDKNPISYNDSAIQRTLALGPVGLKAFLKWYKHGYVTLTIFHKIFSNLLHDWDLQSDTLFLGWVPYKFGPIPIWPSLSGFGNYPEYKKILLDQNSIEEKVNTSKKGSYRLYRPNDNSLQVWEKLYKKGLNVSSRVNVSSLTRLYSRIQETIVTTRLISPYSDKTATRKDALIVLSAARNERIAYICAQWEVAEWIRIAKNKVLPQLQTVSVLDEIPRGYYLRPSLADFLEPARLLFDKIEMYLNIGHLYKYIEILKEKETIEIAEALLEKIDQEPILRDEGDYPVRTLQWFSKVMFSYTFLLRQIMNNFDLDIDQRFDIEKQTQSGDVIDANFYLDELMKQMPEISAFQKPLKKCIDLSNKKKYDEFVTQTLSNTFHLIVKTIEATHRIPDPLSESNKKRITESWEGTIRILREMPINQAPYAIAVADIKNLVNLPRIASDLLGIEYDDAVVSLLKFVEEKTKEVVKKYQGVRIGGFGNDNIFLCGTKPDEVYTCIKELISKTTQQISTAENKLEHYGLLRVGIAWKEDERDNEFKGIRPGLLALRIGDKSGLNPGSISITQEILERLSKENQSEFDLTEGLTGQGKLYLNVIVLKSNK